MEFKDPHEMSSSGLAWLLHMGAVETDVVKNAIVLNIRQSSMFIKDLEILSDAENRKMLVLLRLNWIGRWLFQIRIAKNALSILQNGLPSFQFRVIYDEVLFQKAIDLSKKLIARRQVLPPRN